LFTATYGDLRIELLPRDDEGQEADLPKPGADPAKQFVKSATTDLPAVVA
jgi:hypothetical protein